MDKARKFASCDEAHKRKTKKNGPSGETPTSSVWTKPAAVIGTVLVLLASGLLEGAASGLYQPVREAVLSNPWSWPFLGSGLTAGLAAGLAGRTRIALALRWVLVKIDRPRLPIVIIGAMTAALLLSAASAAHAGSLEANFEAVKVGLTEPAVIALMGRPADASSSSRMLGIIVETLRWTENGYVLVVRLVGGPHRFEPRVISTKVCTGPVTC